MNEKERDDELEEMAPNLSHWRQCQQKDSEGVPEDYFQNFEARLQQRLETEEALTPKAGSSSPSWLTRWAAWWRPTTWALVPALALLLWWNGQETVPNVDEAPNFAELSEGELDAYIEQNIESLTTQELAAVLDEEVLQPELIVVKEALVEEEQTEETEASSSAASSLDRALEETALDDLLEELSIEEIEGTDDWL